MNNKKIILLNDTTLKIGGAENYMYSLSNALEKRGYKVKVIGSNKGVDLKDSFFSRWYSFKYYKLLQKEIQDFKPSLIHVHGFSRSISPSPLVAAKKYKIPVIQSVHDYNFVCPKLWMIDKNNNVISSHESFVDCLFNHLPQKNIIYTLFKLIKVYFHNTFCKKYIDYFICPSDYIASFYYKKYGSNKVTKIPYFIDEEMFKFASFKNFNMLLYIGRLSKEKGLDVLINAIPLIIKDLPDVKLTISGEGPDRKRIEDLVKRLNITDNVNFTGKVDYTKIPNLINESTVVIIPSLWLETGPLVAIESIFSGRPIIGSDAGGIKDIILTSKAGLIFKRGDYLDLAFQTVKILKNKTVLLKFHNHALNSRGLYSKENHINKILRLYSNISHDQKS